MRKQDGAFCLFPSLGGLCVQAKRAKKEAADKAKKEKTEIAAAAKKKMRLDSYSSERHAVLTANADCMRC